MGTAGPSTGKVVSSPMPLLDRLRRALDPDAHAGLPSLVPSGRTVASWLVPDDELARVEAMPFRDRGHGFDEFGLSRDGMALGLALTHWLYHRWFRVTSHGIEHVPAEGPVVVASNHSGTVPLDGLMICADLMRRGPMRVPRAVVDHFVARMPVVAPFFARAGAIGGARANFHYLLSHGELVVVFPEGTKGIGKPFSERYHLQTWSEGHAELAIRHGAAVVPLAVIGAEEQMPQVARWESFHLFGAPWLPIPVTLFPLPVHYHLWYGEPIPTRPRWTEADADDPAAVGELAAETRAAVEDLIAHGLRARTGIFT